MQMSSLSNGVAVRNEKVEYFFLGLGHMALRALALACNDTSLDLSGNFLRVQWLRNISAANWYFHLKAKTSCIHEV